MKEEFVMFFTVLLCGGFFYFYFRHVVWNGFVLLLRKAWRRLKEKIEYEQNYRFKTLELIIHHSSLIS